MGTEPGVFRVEVWLKYTTKETLSSSDHDHPVGRLSIHENPHMGSEGNGQV